MANLLPIPDFFEPSQVDRVWRVPYQQRAQAAHQWAEQHQITAAATDNFRTCLLLIDVQNTFCLPEFELFVGGRSGRGAVEDNLRLCEFIYRNLGRLTEIVATLDTHTAVQIFHPVFWVDAQGQHPTPMATLITYDQVVQGVWRVNPAIAPALGGYEALQQYALHYTQRLTEAGKYPLTVWCYHAMLGGIGHALVSAVEEAVFFHNLARSSQTEFAIKGGNPLTENYSVLCPEVLDGPDGRTIAQRNTGLIDRLLGYDAVIIAGQAKSHCVAWTIADLLAEIQLRNPKLAEKIYLLEDCTSPVVVPGVVDYTEAAEAAYQRFQDAGMHLVRSTEAIADWVSAHA